jgi:hypothetical protein
MAETDPDYDAQGHPQREIAFEQRHDRQSFPEAIGAVAVPPPKAICM